MRAPFSKKSTTPCPDECAAEAVEHSVQVAAFEQPFAQCLGASILACMHPPRRADEMLNVPPRLCPRWKGLVGDVQTYSCALSPEEVGMFCEAEEPPRKKESSN